VFLLTLPQSLLDNLVHAYYTPTRREGAILQSPCPLVRPSVCPSVHTFVTDISASTGRNDFIFDICLPFPGLPHIYFLFTVRLTNERVGVFLARRSMQHLVEFLSQIHGRHL
jgi:hypothetical protein